MVSQAKFDTHTFIYVYVLRIQALARVAIDDMKQVRLNESGIPI